MALNFSPLPDIFRILRLLVHFVDLIFITDILTDDLLVQSILLFMGIDKLITGVVILGLFNILNYKLYFILTIQVGVLIIIWLVRLNAIIVYII